LMPFLFFGTISLLLAPPIGLYFSRYRKVKMDPLEAMIGE